MCICVLDEELPFGAQGLNLFITVLYFDLLDCNPHNHQPKHKLAGNVENWRRLYLWYKEVFSIGMVGH